MSNKMITAAERLRASDRKHEEVQMIPEFPDGNTDYRLCAQPDTGQIPRCGWSRKQTTQTQLLDGTTVRYFKCMGRLACPHAGCETQCRPMLSQKQPKGRRRTCRLHKIEMVLEPCDCTWRYRIPSDKHQPPVLSHSGTHQHPRPHVVKARPASQAWLQSVVAVSSSITPAQLALGTAARPAARDVDSAWINRDALAADRRKVVVYCLLYIVKVCV